MATLVVTNMRQAQGAVVVARNILTASDVLPYSQGQVIEFYNTTAAAVTVTIDGANGTTFAPAGYGSTIDISAGKPIQVPASGTVSVNLDSISLFLSGVVAVTGGVGLTAHLYQF